MAVYNYFSRSALRRNQNGRKPALWKKMEAFWCNNNNNNNNILKNNKDLHKYTKKSNKQQRKWNFRF